MTTSPKLTPLLLLRRQGRMRRVFLAGLLLLTPLAGCEDMAYALRPEGRIAETLREGRIDIVHEEF